MTVIARYSTRKGGSGIRPIRSRAEAEKILRGAYSVTEVVLEDSKGNIVGERCRMDGGHNNRVKWFWSFDKDAFDR